MLHGSGAFKAPSLVESRKLLAGCRYSDSSQTRKPGLLSQGKSRSNSHHWTTAVQHPTVELPTRSPREENGSQRHSNGNTAALQDSPKEEVEEEQFDWTKAWYPVGIERDTPSDRPVAVRLMGNPIVLWKDGDQKWRAFQDLCPHRLAPLSEGRVENGELMCSYHGWQFRGDGKATVIPQADDEKCHQTAVQSKRSCCIQHPCEVHEGLIWVYASSDASADTESQSVPKASLGKLEDPNYCQLTPWFVRELPYGADVLCENVMDPSHVPFSHHGVQGNRFKVLKMLMKPAEKVDPTEGFSVHSYSPATNDQGKSRVSYDLSFRPPSLIRYQYASGSELVTHCVPIEPSKSRIYFTLIFPSAKMKGLMGAMMKLKTSKWFLWFDHFERNNVLDGDNVFLALQDHELRHRKTREASRNYFMPTSLDLGVRALRNWLTKLAKPVPWGQGAIPAPSAFGQSRQQMLDRYNQHTKHCPSCLAAHKTFGITQWVGAYAAVFFAAYMAFVLGNGASFKNLLLPSLAVAISAAVGFVSRNFKQQLEFVDYRHPEH